MAKVQTRRPVAKARNQFGSHDKYPSFESLISELLARFVKIPDIQTDSEIEDAIRRICLYLGLDQGLLVQWERDETHPMPTHSWTVPGGLPPPVLPGTEVVPWVHSQSVLGNIVMFSRVEDLPAEAARDKEFFRASGRKSLISLPLKIGGSVIGVLVFASLHAEIPWPDDVVLRLELIGDFFAGILDRKNRELELEKRLRFEHLLFDLSARFVNIAPDKVEEEIEQSLKRILEFFEVDRCGLLKTSPNRKSYQVALVAYAKGIPPVPEKTDLPFSLFPWAASRILDQHEIVYMKSTDDLPPEADVDRQSYQAFGIKSCMTIPILASDSVTYVLSIDAVSEIRAWPEDYGPRLRLLGEVFVNALERRRIDKELQQSEARLSLAADSAGAGLWSMEVGSSMVSVNARLRDLFSFPADEELTYQGFLSVIHPEDRERVHRFVEQAVQGKGSIDVEYRIVLPDKSIRWISARGKPHYTSSKAVDRLIGLSVDITERKLAEEARLESMERYSAMVEGFDGLIYICSQDYRMEFMNKRMIERTGRNAADEPCFKALHDRDSVCEWCVNERVFRGETVRWEVQSPKDLRWYYVVNTPIRHADGTMSKQSMIMDITERKLAEEALKKNEAALRISQQDLKRLAGRLISVQEEELRRLSRELHDDLTQKLAVLAIEAGKLEQELKKIPGSSSSASQKISDIKDQLIRVSEEVHQISRQIHPSILDDLGLVRAIESECATFLRRENVKVTFISDNGIPSIPKDIALCLYRIVQESLKNVVKHSRAESTEIFLKSTDNSILLSIKDSGIGFDPREVLQKRGLGLASMRERVQLVGGDFSVESRPGQGTVVNVSVPLTGHGE